MKLKHLTIYIFIAVVIVVSALLYPKEEKNDKDVLKIGAILSLTGRGAKYGKASLMGLEIAAEETNQSSSIKGKKLKLLVEDSMSEAKAAISAYHKLVDFHGVVAVVGPILSDEVLAVAPEANRKHILIIAPAAGTDEIETAGKYVYRNRESANLQSERIARYLLDQSGEERVAIIYSMTSNAISYRKSFISALGSKKSYVVLDESFAEGQTDFRSLITKLKSVNPTHVFLPGLAPEIARILEQGRNAGIKVQWLSTAGAYDPNLLAIAGEAAEGLIFGAPVLNNNVSNSPAARLDHSLMERYKMGIDMVSANSYDALKMIIFAAETKGLHPEEIRLGLLEIIKFPGAGGLTTFEGPGKVHKPIALMTVKNGKFILLDN